MLAGDGTASELSGPLESGESSGVVALRGSGAARAAEDRHTKPRLLQKRPIQQVSQREVSRGDGGCSQGGLSDITQAVLRRRQASHGRFLRLRGCLAWPKLLLIVYLREEMPPAAGDSVRGSMLADSNSLTMRKGVDRDFGGVGARLADALCRHRLSRVLVDL